MNRQPNIPQSLPMLPGHTKQDPTLTHFHKAQIFNTTVGGEQQLIETQKMGDVEIDHQLLQSLRDGTATQFNAAAKTMIPPRQGVQNDAIPKAPPKWLKHDRQVLRYNVYFQEPVHENPDENYRLRKCYIYYHLDDDTLYVTEPKIQNSGIPQGVFLKRHKVPKKQNSREHYTWQDLNIGMNIEIYGRVFRIYDCDDFTRNFYSNNMVALNPAEDIPNNPFDTTRFKANLKVPPADAGEHKQYIEVKLGGGHPNRNLNRYMNNDRKVLSYKIQWNDTSYDGGFKYYTLNYFLSDGTIEVKEVIEQNCGRDPFPMMLKRQKLAKRAIMTHYPGMSLKKEDYYQPEDLDIGSTIDVHGRQCLIYDCDEFTKQWLKDNLGRKVEGIKLGVASSFSKAQPIPNYNGFGTEQDSLGSVFSLQPKPPRKDVNKMFKSDMHILRFEAKLVSPDSDDETRKFMIKFYCGDDTIQVTEICEKNSGRIGGKFMERKKHKHPFNEKRYLEELDFQIGDLVMLGGFKFRLTTADEYTLKYMEDNPEIFPTANVYAIISRIKRGYSKFGTIEEYASHLMKILDVNQDGFISFEELKSRLESLDTYLTHHEMTTLVRAFDRNNDGKISMQELVDTIKAS